MNKIFLIALLSTLVFAKYDNCQFKNKNYSEVCKKAVRAGVTYEYANQFLMSYFKTQKFDEVSWEYLKESRIAQHNKNEKKANNSLLSAVPAMVENLKEYKEMYDYVEQEYKVNREVVAAILLKETRLGVIKPKHDAFLVFNTIVTRTKPDTSRNKRLLEMGKSNMVAIIRHCFKTGVEPEECNLPSSYAGAVGIPQFMPNSFKYAESYQSRVVDLTKMEDAITSAAKYLNIRADFDKLIEWEKISNLPQVENEWYEYDHNTTQASFVYEKNSSGKKLNCFTKNRQDLAYIRNYTKKIMSYNNSSNYAIGVLRLAYEAHLALIHKN